MFRIFAIIQKNRRTFYDYRTGESRSLWMHICLFALVALICGLVLDTKLDAFLEKIITIESILIGFSFSIMFFLLSDKGIDSGGSLEGELRETKLKNLSHEIFDNVAYFNLISMVSLLVAVLLILPPVSDGFAEAIPHHWLMEKIRGARLFVYGRDAISASLRILFYFSLFEGAYTFARTVGRVNYFFEEKLRLHRAAQ